MIVNKKQKRLIIISTVLFLFVTLNPSVFQITPHDIGDFPRRNYSPLFSKRPMYEYWAVIAVPSVALFYYLKDKNEKDKNPKDD